jgi:DNA-binding transcriptional regulator YdaS (Cro superfamily)
MHISYSMNLRKWLDESDSPTVTAFAARLGVTRVYLSQLAARQDGRVPSAALASAIERESGGAVARQDLRPDDYWLIWPDLPAPAAAPAEPATLG